jgi:hypothetical protein
MSYCVYKHTFPNGKVYIGITGRTPERRWDKGRGYSHNNYMNNAIAKYGWDNVKHDILVDNLTKEEAEEKEIELISTYKSNDLQHGYNIANGGNCAGTMSESTKRKIAEGRMGKDNPMFGKYGSDNPHSIKINQYDMNGVYIKTWDSSADAERELGIPKTKIIACCRNKRKSAQGYQWKYFNGDIRNINSYVGYHPFGSSNSMYGKPSHLRKKVIQKDLEGNVIAIYDSLKEADKQTGVSFKSISSCCNGKRKTSHGYIWCFE